MSGHQPCRYLAEVEYLLRGVRIARTFGCASCLRGRQPLLARLRGVWLPAPIVEKLGRVTMVRLGTRSPTLRPQTKCSHEPRTLGPEAATASGQKQAPGNGAADDCFARSNVAEMTIEVATFLFIPG